MIGTINRMFRESVARFSDRPALARKQEGHYRALTYSELGAEVHRFASGLAALGVSAGDRLALISENRPEWVIADLGILALGAVNVPMFTTLPAAQVSYIIGDSGSRALIVSSRAQLAKALEVRRQVPELRIIAFDCPGDLTDGVVPFAEVMVAGDASPLTAAEYEARREASSPDDLASIVYTSGTTGDPKGVMLTHGNLAANVESCQAVMSFTPEDVFLSFLPLNHCLERVGGYYLPLSRGSQIAYAESLHRLRDNIREVEPTCMVLVPRLCETFQDAILDRIAKVPAPRRQLADWALSVGRQRAQRRLERQPLGPGLALQWVLADRLVPARLREAGGFRRLRAFVAGGAPPAVETALFFHAAGLPVLEGYGLTESSPVITFNRLDHCRLGTVGQPVPEVEVRIGPEGEVLCRGPNVMRGYFNKPEATAAALDGGGWLHTGDVGELDAEGFLRITDRLKDLIVLTNGKKVAPQPIESTLRTSPYLAQVVLMGDGQATVAALVVPAFERLADWARQQGMSLPEQREAIVATPEVAHLLRGEIDRLSVNLADFEKVRGFTIMPGEFTVESGELTPTLKVRRRAVMANHADLIARMYAGG